MMKKLSCHIRRKIKKKNPIDKTNNYNKEKI